MRQKAHRLFRTLAILAALSFTGTSYSQELLLSIGVAMGGAEMRQNEVEAMMGEEADVPASEGFRLTVVATQTEAGFVRLAFRLYEGATGSGEPISTPTVITADGVEARIREGSDPPKPQNLEIRVTPRIL